MISFKEILRSAFTRFLPGWAVMFVAISLMFLEPFWEMRLAQLALLSAFTAAALVGHVGVLVAMRRYFRSDTAVVSSRSVVAGAMSVVGFVISSFAVGGGRSLVLIVATYFAIAALLTAGVYFPWIRTASAEPERAPERA